MITINEDKHSEAFCFPWFLFCSMFQNSASEHRDGVFFFSFWRFSINRGWIPLAYNIPKAVENDDLMRGL